MPIYDHGNTLLHLGVQQQNVAMVGLLLQHKIDRTIRNNAWFTAKELVNSVEINLVFNSYSADYQPALLWLCAKTIAKEPNYHEQMQKQKGNPETLRSLVAAAAYNTLKL